MSTFTALNGGSPKATDGVNGGVEMAHAASKEKLSNGPAQTLETSPTSGTSPSTRVREVQWERERENREQEREQRDRERERERGRDRDRGDRPNWPTLSIERPHNYHSAGYAENDNTHKRKRSSESPEPRREHPSTHDRPRESSLRRPSPTESRDPYESPYRSYADESREHDSWHSQGGRYDRGSAYDAPDSAAPDSARTEEQIGEALRRAAGHMDSQGDYPQTSPDGDDRSVIYGSQYSPDNRRDPSLQSDPKKRKRNFSNRTKTGCLTCRKRKKKCDELKPECSNCVKGGFVCAGYPPQRGSWPKPENKPTTVQIESKDPTYVPPGAYGMPQQHPYVNQPGMPQQKREPLPSYRGQPLRIEPPQGRLLNSDDDRPTASTLPSASVGSPDISKLSALSSAYTNAASMFPTPVSAATTTPFPDRTPKDQVYQRVPALKDIGRNEPDMPALGHTLPQINIMHATRTNSPTAQPQTQRETAQAALSQVTFPSTRAPRRQKDEMLQGRPYYPFDKELVLERERCSAAVWRFNNSTNPNNGVSPTERARLFREILQPREGIQLSPTETSPITHNGRVGNDVVVEAPFTADYGYNIHIGKNVVVNKNCTIMDHCEVTIGDNTVIGPNVCIYTATLPTDHTRRAGSRGTQTSKPVVIEDNVYIGANVVILPGVTIGRGTTVGACSLVTKSLKPYCVCYGQPAVVQRGVSGV